MHLKLVSVDFHILELVNFVSEMEKLELKYNDNLSLKSLGQPRA